LEEIDLTCSENDAPALKNTQTYDIPKRCMSIREARSKRSTGIPIPEAQGHICAEYIWAYPPGIPYLIPGEKITREITDILKEAIDNGIDLKTDNNKQGYITVLCN
jgi:arginine/lysine/ornithine decarboxylase